MREMVSFEFVKEMEKDVFRCVFDERERKISESSWGIEPHTSGFRAPMLYHWTTETLRWAKNIYRMKDMVSFELGKE